MNTSRPILRLFSRISIQDGPSTACRSRRPQSSPLAHPIQCLHHSPQRRFAHNPADNPDFESILNKPVKLVQAGKKHGPGLIILAIIPITAFALGTWQVQRLSWKTDLIARFEDRLIRPPLPLPPHVDSDAIKDFDYRRVYATGRLRHDQEMLVGPRLHDGNDGYLVVTPLEREEKDSKVLVCRGWISKEKKEQKDRKAGLPEGEVTVQGLLREPWKKNLFTPENHPERGEFYFPDVEEMAKWSGSQSVWIEETMRPDLLEAYDRELKGIPIGRSAEVNLRNNHTQYIFTWYALCACTSVMLWMVIRKPPSSTARRVKHSTQW